MKILPCYKLRKGCTLLMVLAATVFFLLGVACNPAFAAVAPAAPAPAAAPAAASTNDTGLAGIADKVTGNLGSLAKLITAGSYVAGMGFAVAAILKFKAHKDNPTQIPVGTPIALVFIASALIFLPSMFKAAGETLFGNEAKTATIQGTTDFGAGGDASGGTTPPK